MPKLGTSRYNCHLAKLSLRLVFHVEFFLVEVMLFYFHHNFVMAFWAKPALIFLVVAFDGFALVFFVFSGMVTFDVENYAKS